MPNVNDLLSKAINETARLNKGETFIVRDLFKGYEWNRISRGDRLLLGTLFLNMLTVSMLMLPQWKNPRQDSKNTRDYSPRVCMT